MGQMIRSKVDGSVHEWVPGEGWVYRVQGMPKTSAVDAALIGAGQTLHGWGQALGITQSGPGDPEYAGPLSDLASTHPVAKAVGQGLPYLPTALLGSGAFAGAEAGAALAGAPSALYAALGPTNAIAQQALIGTAMGAALTPGGLAERAKAAVVGGVLSGGGQALGDMIGRGVSTLAGIRSSRVAAEVERQAQAQAAAAAPVAAAAAGPVDYAARAREMVAQLTPEQLATTPAPIATVERTRLENRAQELGVLLTRADRANSIAGKQWEAAAESHPLTSALYAPVRAANADRFAKIALNAIGEPAPRGAAAVGPAQLGSANLRLGEEFRNIALELGDLVPDRQFNEGMMNVVDGISSGWIPKKDTADMLTQGLSRWQETGVTGPALMQVRHELNQELRRAAVAGDGQVVDAMRGAIGEIDALVSRQAGPGVAGRYGLARDQWRALHTLERPGVLSPKGQVNGRSLTSAMRRDYPAEFLRGDMYGTTTAAMADLFDAARISGEFGDVVGNSGTATRQTMSELLSNPSLGGLGTLAVQGTLGRVTKAVVARQQVPEIERAVAAALQNAQDAAFAARGAAAGRAAGKAAVPLVTEKK